MNLSALIDGRELKRLLVLMVPLLIAHLMHMGMGVVDTIVAGRAGPEELSAVALGGSVVFPVNVAMMMILSMVAPIISRYRGAGMEGKVGYLLNNAKVLAFILTVLDMAILFGLSYIYPLVTDNAVLAEKAQLYAWLLIAAVPANALFRVAQGCFEGYGQTRPAMILSTVGLLLNIPLNYIFVFGWWCIPAMGGVGCGLATAIIQWLMCGGIYLFLFATRFRKFAVRMWVLRAPDWRLIRHVLRLGFPLGVASFCEMTFFSAMLLVIAPLGELMMSAQQVAINISGVAFMLPLSMGIAASIRAAYHVGAQNRRSFDAMLRTIFTTTGVLVTSCMIFMLFFRADIISLFTESREVAVVAELLIFYCCIYQIPDAVQAILSGLLRGCHDTVIITPVNLCCYWIVGFPLACILIRTDWICPAMGPAGAWVCFIISLSLAAILFTCRFIRTRKKVFSNHQS